MKSQILVLILLVAVVPLIYVSTSEGGPKEMNYYLENTEARKAKLKECAALGFQAQLENKDCINVADAQGKARMDKALSGFKPSKHPGVPLNSY